MGSAAGKMAREFRLHLIARRKETKSASNARDSLKFFFCYLTARKTYQSRYSRYLANYASTDTLYKTMRQLGAE